MKYTILIFILTIGLNSIYSEECSNYNSENSCNGRGTEYPSDWVERKFQTPPRGDPLWRESYQDLHLITGYAQIKYNNPAKTEATLNFITKVNEEKLPKNFKIIYYFGETKTENNTFIVKSTDSTNTETGNLFNLQ